MATLQKLIRWLQVKQLSEQLKVSENWIYVRTMRGEIPFHRLVGSRILWFDPDEIDRWLRNQPPVRRQYSRRRGVKLGRPPKPRSEGEGRER